MTETIDSSDVTLKVKRSLSLRQLPTEEGSCDRVGALAVSICVCTYRRPQLLAMLLDSLAEQSFCKSFEVVVVDNDAAGGAAEAIEAVRKRHPKLGIRYAVESRRGISFARNTVASLANGDFLAWIDDDETATKDWLMLLWMARLVNNADAVFGPVVPIFPEGSRSWAKHGGIFERPRHLTGTIIDAREARTGNALVDANWFRTLSSPFDIRFANTGGEDYDFFARIEKRGARFEWCDEAEVSEMVPLERQRLVWILERRLRASTHYWRSHSASRVRMAIRASTGGVACVVLGIAGVIAAPFGFHYAVRLWCRAMGGLGRAIAISGVHWDGY